VEDKLQEGVPDTI
jgi:phospholipid-transporting ATPase